jgi:CubicO group peptidase (beta-lactamase class C family)
MQEHPEGMMSERTDLPRSTPEAQGISSAAIQAFVEAADRQIQDLHGVMLLRHGQVVAEGWWDPYRPDDPHMLFSLSKSFTATAIGLLEAEGRVSVDDFVLPFFADQAPPAPAAFLQAMRVQHLLTMTTGHDADTLDPMRRAGNWMRTFLSLPLRHEPGTFFLYNTGATYMLSAIVQRITGMRLLDYLAPRLFEPLGIVHPTWEVSPEGIDCGGFGLNATTPALARFGQLYLQRGAWQGRQLVPASWVDRATARQVPNGTDPESDWAQGYGYQFWRCRHGAYRGDGAFGQFCVVLPDQDTVLAVTAGTPTMQQVLNLVWEYLLPALAPAPLPAQPEAHEALRTRLATLRLAPPPCTPAAAATGTRYVVAPNDDHIDALSFDWTGQECTLGIQREGREHRIRLGCGSWARGAYQLDPNVPDPIVAAGTWADPAVFEARIRWVESPFALAAVFRFEGDQLIVEQRMNVGFGSTERSTLHGRRVP